MARIISFGEVLLRLASPGQGLLLQEPLLVANFCGAEVNAATALAGFGHDCAVVTALPDSEIGDAAMSDLRKFNLDTEFVSRSANRMGQYFLGVGAMNRPSRKSSTIEQIQRSQLLPAPRMIGTRFWTGQAGCISAE